MAENQEESLATAQHNNNNATAPQNECRDEVEPIPKEKPLRSSIPPPIPSHSPVKTKQPQKTTEDEQVAEKQETLQPSYTNEGHHINNNVPPLIPSHAKDETLEKHEETNKETKKDSISFGDLPPTPPEEWETSEDRLGGKLYSVVKDFKARHDFEINVKKGELVELTEIDPEDKTWHVRVTLGTGLDGYQYTKRVGWVPAEYFEEYTGPDPRKRSQSLTDVSGVTVHNTLEGDVSLEEISRDDLFDMSVVDKRRSRSISEVSAMANVVMRAKGRRQMSDMTHNSSPTTKKSLYRQTGSWRGGSAIHHHYGHRFQANSLHMPVRCTFCNKWCGFHKQDVCEYQCLACKLVVHKGCHDKILTRCQLFSEENDDQCHSDDDDEDSGLSIDLPHRFRVHTWKKPTTCCHCGSFILGIIRQGLKCAECGSNIHHKCKPNVTNSCSTQIKELAEKLYEVKQDRIRERKKSTISVDTSQVISCNTIMNVIETT